MKAEGQFNRRISHIRDKRIDETAKAIERKPIMETLQECLEEKVIKSCREIKKREKLLDREIMTLGTLNRAALRRAYNHISICRSFLKFWISLLNDYPWYHLRLVQECSLVEKNLNIF